MTGVQSPGSSAPVAPILELADLDDLRTALMNYTVDTVHESLGPIGRAALDRADLAGVARAIRGDRSRLATLIALFVLGVAVDEPAARSALTPLPLERAGALIECSAGSARALVDVRPYAEAGVDRPWWVVSDFGSDVRGRTLDTDHVLGIGTAALTLAQSTPRTRVDHALDIGTGCGIQALHLSTHSRAVTATDVSPRALRMAATTATLSGQDWDLRLGNLFEPVDRETVDLIVANPPFVVSAGDGGYDYRDSGLAGDAVCRELVRGIGPMLSGDGVGQLLANWIVPTDGDADARLGDWFAGCGCDAWVWRREVAEPAEYVSLWLRDAGEVMGSPRWTERYDRWLDWFSAAGVAAIGMGLITMWRTDSSRPILVIEDVPQPVERPSGSYVTAWIGRRRALHALGDRALLDMALVAADGLVRERSDLISATDGWVTASTHLRQSYGMRWELETDDAVGAVVAGCDGTRPLRTTLEVLAAALGESLDDVADAMLPVVRDLVGRGLLEFSGAPPIARPGATP